MKLFVIVICLLIERYLIHSPAHHRMNWFFRYNEAIQSFFKRTFLKAQGVMLALVIIPPTLLLWAIFYSIGDWVYGLVGLLLQIVIFYMSIGPNNPFYVQKGGKEKPANKKKGSEDDAGIYLAEANTSLFAVVFWFIVFGPVGAFFYRLVVLSQGFGSTKEIAFRLTTLLEWLPARLTALLYLIVGHFQAGRRDFAKFFFWSPLKNTLFLEKIGIEALGPVEDEVPTMVLAERLVEHAIIAMLVLLALFTLGSV